MKYTKHRSNLRDHHVDVQGVGLGPKIYILTSRNNPQLFHSTCTIWGLNDILHRALPQYTKSLMYWSNIGLRGFSMGSHTIVPILSLLNRQCTLS